MFIPKSTMPFWFNGKCGYMIKPDEMAEAAFQSDAINDSLRITLQWMIIWAMTGFSQFPAKDLIKVSISVICGRFMPDISI